MNVLISEDEYKELHTLRSYYKRENNLKSANSMKSLENDIDLPIRTIVGMFALMGCWPRFSCCGFDYEGQPIHKTHEYGNAYVMLSNNYNTEQVIDFLVGKELLVETATKKTSRWRTWKVEKENIVFIALAFDWLESKRDYPWTKTNCIHYAEKGVIGLNHLRKWLYRLRKACLEEITLTDTNEQHNKNLAYWQYPALEPWGINKEELIEEIEKEIT